MIISINEEEPYDTIEYLFMIKTLGNLGIEGFFLHLTKDIHKYKTEQN